jgi:hypothetical protein
MKGRTAVMSHAVLPPGLTDSGSKAVLQVTFPSSFTFSKINFIKIIFIIEIKNLLKYFIILNNLMIIFFI